MKIALGVLGGVVLLGVAVYVVDFFLTRGDVPRGATVGGVEIGGMKPAAAATTLENHFGDVTSRPVNVRAGELTSTFVPDEAGVAADWAATVEAAGRQSLNPITRIKGLFTTYEVGLVSRADAQSFGAAVKRMDKELTKEPVNGAVRLEEGRVVTEPAQDGQDIDAGELRDSIVADWLSPGGIEISHEVLKPDIDDADVRAVAEGPARRAVSGPVTAHGEGEAAGVIPVERMGEVVQVGVEKRELKVNVDVDAAKAIFAETLAQTEKPLKNARLVQEGADLRVIPHSDGVTIDWDDTLTGLPERIVGEEPRDFDVTYDKKAADITTEAAERMAAKANFDGVMGEFTTSGFSEASGHNIRVIARHISGTIVLPGEVFSVNDFTGHRGTEQGYIPAGTIENGRPSESVGGGISQFATTLYNAYYFAGLEDVTHTPHSYYISRYPAGREATLFDGAIDLAFRNNTDQPVRIDASVGDDSVTVQIRGTRQFDVQSIDGGRWDYTNPTEQVVTGDECIPAAGSRGFTTSDTRIIRDLSGAELSRNTTTTIYQPEPIVRCR